MALSTFVALFLKVAFYSGKAVCMVLRASMLQSGWHLVSTSDSLVCGHGQFKNLSFNFLICKMVTVKTYQIVLLQRLRNITNVNCIVKFSTWSKTFQCVIGKAVIILSTISVSQRLLTWGM